MNIELTHLIEWRKGIFNTKEETRNSLMIEGIFFSEDKLQEALNGRYKSSEEVLNYFRTERFFCDLAFEHYKTGEKSVFDSCRNMP